MAAGHLQGMIEGTTVVCRDAQGIYLGASARVFYACTDPVTLEVLACSKALGLAMDLHIQVRLLHVMPLK